MEGGEEEFLFAQQMPAPVPRLLIHFNSKVSWPIHFLMYNNFINIFNNIATCTCTNHVARDPASSIIVRFCTFQCVCWNSHHKVAWAVSKAYLSVKSEVLMALSTTVISSGMWHHLLNSKGDGSRFVWNFGVYQTTWQDIPVDHNLKNSSY